MKKRFSVNKNNLSVIKNLSTQIDLLKENKIILENQAIEFNKVLADLLLSQNQANALNKAQMNFIANISHELRTPLNAILGFAQVMKDEIFGPINNKTYKDYIEYILSSAKDLLSLINDVLDLSKIQANKTLLYETKVNLNKLLEETILIAKNFPLVENKKFSFYSDYEIILKADEKILKQIFLNILSNAIKFTKNNGKIDIYLKLNSFGVKIVFKDDGIGIPQNKIPYLFHPFYQVENVLTRTHSGSGLGLVLVKKMVILHQGRVELTSVLSKGTTLIVELPAERIISMGDKNEGF